MLRSRPAPRPEGGRETSSSTSGVWPLRGAVIGTIPLSAGAGGAVTITAGGPVSISDVNGFRSQITANTGVAGDAGSISLSTPSLTIDQGTIAANSFGDGRAGDIRLNVGRLALTGGASISNISTATGQAGAVEITAREQVSLSGVSSTGVSSTIRSQATGGNAGSVSISTPTLTAGDGAFINTSTIGAGAAGSITLEVGNLALTGGAAIDSSTDKKPFHH